MHWVNDLVLRQLWHRSKSWLIFSPWHRDLYMLWVWLKKKRKNLQIINAGEDMEKKEFSYTVGRNVSWLQPLWRRVWSFLKNLITEFNNRVTM